MKDDRIEDEQQQSNAPRPVVQDITVNGRTFRITIHVAAIEPGGGGQGGGGGGDFSG